MRLSLLLTALILFVFHSVPAFADEGYCTADKTIDLVDLGNIFVPSNSAQGDIVKVSDNSINVTCNAEASAYQQTGEPDVSGWGTTGETFASPEGITCEILDKGFVLEGTGLGLVWLNYNSSNNSWVCLSPALRGNTIRRGLARRGVTTLTDKFYVVRTGLPLSYGNAGVITQSILINEADADRIPLKYLYTIQISGDVNIEGGGCTINNQPEVAMGTVSMSTFRGVGSKGSDVPFSVNLEDCYGKATIIDIAFEPTNGFADAANSVIAINEGSNSASGVGIQVLFNGDKINTDGKSHKYPLNGTSAQLPMVARYYQTDNTVKPGIVDASLLFYIYYE